MQKGFVSRVEVTVNAPVGKVWRALTDPSLIKQYLFGTEVTCDWVEGHPITYRGSWQGKTYEDKGTILKVVPEKTLVSTYWSSMGGRPDVPEAYMTVRYDLAEHGGATRLTLTQDNNATQAEAEHSRKNWEMTMGKLKEVVEALK